MKKLIALLLSAALLLGLLAACGTTEPQESPDAPPASEPAETAGTETPAEPVELKIWHDGDEAIMQTIADTINPMLVESGVSVVFEKRTGLSDPVSYTHLDLYKRQSLNCPASVAAQSLPCWNNAVDGGHTWSGERLRPEKTRASVSAGLAAF